MSLTYTEHQMLSEIVVQLKRIANALEKKEPEVYLTLDQVRKLKLEGNRDD